MAGYSLTTFGSLVTELQTRLGTQSAGFWSQNEIEFYLKESLQVWQAFSQFYNTKAQFLTQARVLFYDLFSLLPELTPTVTDQDLISQIEYHLQEPQSRIFWAGSEQFTFEQVVAAVSNRRDRFKLETGLSQQISEIPGPTAGETSVDLDDTVIDVRRAMWKAPVFLPPFPDNRGYQYSLLWKADEFTLTGGNKDWYTQAGLPTDYSTVLNQPLGIEISPPPANAGWINLFTTNSGPVLDPENGPTVLGIPDDFCWVVKFGALADLFSTPGPGQDQGRADYCESRWKDGIALARLTNFVKLGYHNGVPGFVDSMEELDTSHPSWIGGTYGVPQAMGVSANIVGTYPAPNGIYSMGFDITPKMILPDSLNDFIQIGQEFVSVILDYAQHLAHLKEGSFELQATYRLYQNFAAVAAVENDILRANSQNFDVLSNRSQRESHERLRRQSDMNLTEIK